MARRSRIPLRAFIEHKLHEMLPGDAAWSVDGDIGEVDFDMQLMTSAIWELVQNSKKAINKQEELLITVTLEEYQRQAIPWVKLVFKDNGPGIPGDIKERIFTDFFFSSIPGGPRSTGLGLGLVKRTIEAHSGSIAEEGQYGDGAMFIVRMPKYAPII